MFAKFCPLPVLDQDRAIAFYTRHLGLSVAKDADYSGGWRWVELAFADARTHLLLERRTSVEPSDSPDLVIAVDNLRDLHDRMTAAGVTFQGGPKTASWNPGEISAMFRDSEGNLVLLTENVGGD